MSDMKTTGVRSTNATPLPHPLFELADSELERIFQNRIDRDILSAMRGRKWCEHFDLWPADAQLGVLAIGWAGAGWLCDSQIFKPVRQACTDQKFDVAAKVCRTIGFDVSMRRKLFWSTCFESAHSVIQFNIDRNMLLTPARYLSPRGDFPLPDEAVSVA